MYVLPKYRIIALDSFVLLVLFFIYFLFFLLFSCFSFFLLYLETWRNGPSNAFNSFFYQWIHILCPKPRSLETTVGEVLLKITDVVPLCLRYVAFKKLNFVPWVINRLFGSSVLQIIGGHKQPPRAPYNSPLLDRSWWNVPEARRTRTGARKNWSVFSTLLLLEIRTGSLLHRPLRVHFKTYFNLLTKLHPDLPSIIFLMIFCTTGFTENE